MNVVLPTDPPAEPKADAPDTSGGACQLPLRLRSVDLLQGTDEVLIEHEGACYRLRRTALGRLILTK
ncbi:hemin uptake protein HemP [Sphaerotilus mobilis]|uniref:hemin uptake protein HemP n=1 Tax=Sphaerotilus mobilis TaxID=47994 RepID=UPI001F5FD4F0|nr:hemin uptake protein HemP [Sphaerotilus mobilis]